jgi:hypothetical protein
LSAPGQERKKASGARIASRATGFLCSQPGGYKRGRRGPVQGVRTDSCQLDETKVAAPLEAAWDSIRTGLRRDLGARTFDGWLKPAAIGTLDPESGSLDIVMPSQFMADWVRSHFGERLALAWKVTLPIVRDVRIVAAADAPRPAPLLVLEDIPAPGIVERDPAAPNFDPRYRFESFVVGKANEVAATAARTLATAEQGEFQPLVHPWRHRPWQDPPASRYRPHVRGPFPGQPYRVDVGREVHGRVHPRPEGKRHDRLQGPASRRRPAA